MTALPTDIGKGFLSSGPRGHHSLSTRTPATMTLYSETENDWPLGVIILTALRPSSSGPAKQPEIEELAGRMARLLRPAMSGADVDALRTVWKGPLVLKGIITPA